MKHISDPLSVIEHDNGTTISTDASAIGLGIDPDQFPDVITYACMRFERSVTVNGSFVAYLQVDGDRVLHVHLS